MLTLAWRQGPRIVQGRGWSGFREDRPQRALPMDSHLPIRCDAAHCYLHVIFLLYWLELVLVYATPKTEGDRVGDRAPWGVFRGWCLEPLRPPALYTSWQNALSSLPCLCPLPPKIPDSFSNFSEFWKCPESWPSCPLPPAKEGYSWLEVRPRNLHFNPASQ